MKIIIYNFSSVQQQLGLKIIHTSHFKDLEKELRNRNFNTHLIAVEYQPKNGMKLQKVGDMEYVPNLGMYLQL